MIIVSQDKKEIIIFHNFIAIWIEDVNNVDNLVDWGIKAHSVNGNDFIYILGRYKTEERAKEVLQEIIEFYEISKRHECSSNNGITLFIKETFVYEMPLE